MCIVWFIKSQYALVKNVWGLLILESVFKLQYGRERKVKSLEEKKRLIGRIQFTIHVISKYSWSRSRTCSLSIVVWKKIDRVYDAMVLILESISCAYLSYCYETSPFSSNVTDSWYYHHNHYLVRKLSKRAPRYFKIIEICTGRIQLASCSSFGNFRLPYLYSIIFRIKK